jgi:hypothetical protein
MKTRIETIIQALDANQMSNYVQGPIYSSWIFSINSALINLAVKLVRFPQEGEGVEHMPWEMDIGSDTQQAISQLFGIRNIITDAINELEGGYPPSSIEDTFNWMTRTPPGLADKQRLAAEFIARKKRGEKLHSTVKQYVEDNFLSLVKKFDALIATKDQVIKFLSEADYVKSRSNDAMDASNLPDWLDDMAQMKLETKFVDMYTSKQRLLDRKLTPATRTAIETELILMESVADELGVELPETNDDEGADDEAYIKTLKLEDDEVAF